MNYRPKTFSAALLLLGLAIATQAKATCYADAAERYKLPEELLKAIAKVESGGNPDAMNIGHKKRTKTYDIGLMQINSSWLKKLEKFGITEVMLMEPCQNLMVGAWILSHHLRENGANWNGVGSYNASCRTLSEEECKNTRYGYSLKVYRELNSLQKKSSSQMGVKNTSLVSVAKQREGSSRAIRTVEEENISIPTVTSELSEINKKSQVDHELESIKSAAISISIPNNGLDELLDDARHTD